MLITLRDERVKDHLYPNVFRTQSFHNKTANLLVRLFFLVLRLSSMCSWRSPRKKCLIPCSFTKGWAAHKKIQTNRLCLRFLENRTKSAVNLFIIKAVTSWLS